MKKIKVIEIIPSLKIGGGERVAANIAYGLDEKKFEVFLISLYKNKEKNFVFEKDNVNLIELNKKIGFDISIIFKLVKIFKNVKPDVVHTHLIVAPYTLIPCILFNVKKKFHTVHSIAKGELTRFRRIIMKILYKFFGYIPVAISPYVRKTISEEYKILENKIPCVYNGINIDIFKNDNRKYNTTMINLINVARLSKVKNHKLLIDAFNIAYTKNKNLKLTILGDGEERENIETIVKEYKLEDNVFILGAKQNVQDYLNESDIFILTSDYEGLPMSVLEAMSCGLPVISTKAGGVVDIIKNDYNGYLVESSPESVANAIIKLSSEPEKLVQFFKNNYKDSKKYSIKNMVKGYEELFNVKK